MTTERIDIVVSERGARVVRRNIEDIGRGAQNAQGAVQLLQRALGTIAIGAATVQLTRLVDTYTNLQNRLRNVTTSTSELSVVTAELFDIANSTRSSFESTTEVYARTALALKDLGVSQAQTLSFTKSLNQAVILSGASAQEANAALIQLSQGLASGTLRGDELRSVLEQLPSVADVIAKGLGVTRGELRELGTQGKITAQDILTAFADAREELDERFAKTIPTIGQSLVVLRNNFVQLLGSLDQNIGASETLARFILTLADNMGTLARAVGVAAFVLGVNFGVRAIGAAIGGIRALTVAILANPFGALAVAITTTIGVLVSWSDEIQVAEGRLANLQDFGQAAFEEITRAVNQLLGFFEDNFGRIYDTARAVLSDVEFSFEGVIRFAAQRADNLIGIWRGAFEAIKVIFAALPNSLNDVFVLAMNSALAAVEDGLRRITAGLNSVLEAVGADGIGQVTLGRIKQTAGGGAEALGQAVREGFLRGFDVNVVEGALDRVLSRAEDIARERIAEEQIKAAQEAAARGTLGRTGENKSGAGAAREFEELLDKLRQEQAILMLGNSEREIQNELLKIEKDLKRELTETETERVESLLRETQALKRQAELLDEINAPLQDYKDSISDLNALLDRGSISLEEYNKQVRDARIDLLEQQNTIAAGAERAILKFQRTAQDVGSATERIFSSAFDGLSDAVARFAIDGENTFGDFLKSVGRQIISFMTSQAVSQLLGIFGTATGGVGGGGGGAGSSLLSGAGSFLGSLLGFQTGGQFTVGGAGGPDSQLVAFRATPGESVSISRPQDVQRGAQGNSGGYYYIDARGAENGVEEKVREVLRQERPGIVNDAVGRSVFAVREERLRNPSFFSSGGE